MAKAKIILMVVLVLTQICVVLNTGIAKEKIIEEVPYRNQVLDFPNWSKNWASCGYTSTLMNLLYCEAIPPGTSEQSLIESMYANCSTTIADGSVIFYYEKLDEFCAQYFPESDLEVNFIRGNFEENIKKALDEDNPVICGTFIFGDVGHVILIVGYDDENWIVHDPANAWGKECWPTNGFNWENAAFARFPIGSFTILYGASIYSEKNKDYAAKIIEQSPTVILDGDGEMKMLWVKMINNGTKDWDQDKIHLGAYQPIDRHCGFVAKVSPEKYRWLNTTNRIGMEQKKVPPGQTAIFGIPMEKNGFVGNFPESFRLINDVDNGHWFGPMVTWNVDCQPSLQTNTVYSNNFSGKYYYHQGNLHNHSNWSQEKKSIAELLNSAKKDNLDFLAITDQAEKLGDKEKIGQYLAEINKAAAEQKICLIAGIEYNLLNYANKSFNSQESKIRMIGLGYNNLTPQDFSDWFPWEEKGKNVSMTKLIEWHKNRDLPLIIVHSLEKGINSWSSEELIKNNLFPNLDMVAGMEIFSTSTPNSWLSINGLESAGFFYSDNNLEQILNLYKNFLGPIGMGVAGGNERAKTIIVTTTSQINNEQIFEGINKRKTVASKYGGNFDYIKISDQEWAPGVWEQAITSGEQVKIEGQIRFSNAGQKISSSKQCLYIMRNQQLICKEIVEEKNLGYFVFTDNCYKPGKYSYQIAVCDIKNDKSKEDKVFTSPIYVLVKDKDQVENPMETIDENQKELVLFTPTIHLGDSHYEGKINQGFKREKAEAILTTKIFNLKKVDLENLIDCQLAMEVCGAQTEQKSGKSNPIMINNIKIGECSIPNSDPTKNNLTYTYSVPIDCMQIGSNELFIRSLPWAYCLQNGKTFIDFDDFEMRNLKLIFYYDKKSNHRLSNKGNVLTAEKIPLKEESEKITLVDSQDPEEYSQETEKIISDFGKNGGQFIAESDSRYKNFLELVKPIDDNIDQMPRQTPVKWKFFESNTLDPIALPDRTILVPTGLLTNEKELPENKIFPIVSAIWQSDLGISHKQANRKDLASVLGFLGTVLSKNDNTIAKYVGMGFLLAGSLSLKSEDEDFYIADAYAVDWMKQNGMSVDQAYTILDASSRLEKNSSGKGEYYILAPSADKRLEALTNYIYWQKTYPVPISPEMIDWEKVVKDKNKN